MALPDPSRRTAFAVGTFLLLTVAGVFYVWLLAAVSGPREYGEAAFGQAFEALFLTVFLWSALALLLIVGGVVGEMPRWAAMLALFVHPLSAVGAFVAIDMASRNAGWALAFPGLLPLLIAAYAVWARFPALHRALPPLPASIAAWSAILVLSLLPLPISYWGPGTFG